jgi:hypothetical protein
VPALESAVFVVRKVMWIAGRDIGCARMANACRQHWRSEDVMRSQSSRSLSDGISVFGAFNCTARENTARKTSPTLTVQADQNDNEKQRLLLISIDMGGHPD